MIDELTGVRPATSGLAVPRFPQWAPIALAMRGELHPFFQRLTSGISEFTFSNIYLFRHTYHYKVCRVGENRYAISGVKADRRFFALPWGLPEDEAVTMELFRTHDYLKNFSEDQVGEYGDLLAGWGLQVFEDRDNWDYLYDSQEMAHLDGKKFHKKRNHINSFFQSHTYEARAIESGDTQALLGILDRWILAKDDKGDYIASKESIELREELELEGKLYFVEGQPAAYTLGEAVQQGKSFVIHFEKADNAYKGIYQVVFKDYAQDLEKSYGLINREQDLGDPGLRQSKETYRPVGFIKKHQVRPFATIL